MGIHEKFSDSEWRVIDLNPPTNRSQGIRPNWEAENDFFWNAIKKHFKKLLERMFYHENGYDFKESGLAAKAIQGDDTPEGRIWTWCFLSEVERSANSEYESAIWLHDVSNPWQFPVKLDLIESKYWGIEPKEGIKLYENTGYLILLKKEKNGDLHIWFYRK